MTRIATDMDRWRSEREEHERVRAELDRFLVREIRELEGLKSWASGPVRDQLANRIAAHEDVLGWLRRGGKIVDTRY